jgi:UDP-N-acetyl-2-amino-2-deoxyglucuronate dehydrogenase
VEKPMALTLKDADRMIEACDRAGVKLFVVKQNRYNLPVQKLKTALDQGRFGKPVLGTVRVRWCRDQAYYDQDDWRGTWAMDGGVLTNQASHHIDLLEWCMGEVESVYAQTATRLVDIEVEDTGVALLKFTSGALGVIEATTATRPKDLEGSISILGEHGSVEIAGFAVNEIRTWNFDKEDKLDEEIKAGSNQSPPDVYGFGHKLFLEDVIRSINSNTRGLVDGLEGRKSLELINAIYESVESRREVKLKFRPQHCRLGRNSELQ